MSKTAISIQHPAISNQQKTDRSLLTAHRMKPRAGFTLIEMMVAVTLFSVVMLIGVGALLSLIDANRRAQAINSVVNNMNAALEGMSRSIRVGTTYHCRISSAAPFPGQLSTPQDCPVGGGQLFAFEAANGETADVNDQIVYRINGTQLERSVQAGINGSWVALTAPEVSIDSFEFFVVGAVKGDSIQPRVLMKIQGSAPVPGGTTNFSVQASVTQRIIDI